MGFVNGANLTDREKQYLEMKYWDGLSDDFIASKMGVTDRSVRRLSNSVHTHLRTHLERAGVACVTDIL